MPQKFAQSSLSFWLLLKDQLISKGNFGVFSSSKKQFLIFALAYWGRNFSFGFLKNWKNQRSPFKMNQPSVNVKPMRKIAQIFVAFSEKLNFTYYGCSLYFVQVLIWTDTLKIEKKTNSWLGSLLCFQVDKLIDKRLFLL